MRLWFSVAVLLVLACIVIEISEAKSNRDAGTTKGNDKSVNSKEVRYSKNKSDFKKKGNGNKREVVKEKKQRRSVESVERIDSNEDLKNGKNERNRKVSYEAEKRQKLIKQNKIGKHGENLKHKKNIKIDKNITKKHKRSVEFEQPEESFNNGAADSLAKHEQTRFVSSPKKAAKNKFDEKSTNGKAVDGQVEDDAVVNIEGVSKVSTSSSLDKNTKSLKKNKLTEEQIDNSKKVKHQKRSHKSEEASKKNVEVKKSESVKEKIQETAEPAESDKQSESSNDLPEDGSKKNTKSTNVKKQKCSNKSFETVEKSKKYKSGSCNLKTQVSTGENRTQTEKLKSMADDSTISSVADIDDEEAKDEVSQTEDLKLTEEDEVQNLSFDAEDCIREDSVEESIMPESCSVE